MPASDRKPTNLQQLRESGWVSKTVKQEMRDILQQDAKYFEKSNLWEILEATIVNECANLALIQSKEWSHIENAKMLHHWAHVFKNMIHTLAK